MLAMLYPHFILQGWGGHWTRVTSWQNSTRMEFRSPSQAGFLPSGLCINGAETSTTNWTNVWEGRAEESELREKGGPGAAREESLGPRGRGDNTHTGTASGASPQPGLPWSLPELDSSLQGSGC